MSKETGGPAFPQTRIWNAERREYEDAMYSPGMTLRDYFAGQAVVGLLARGDYDVQWDAYQIADAMLKEREK